MLEVFKPFQMPALISAGILFLSYLIITIKMFGIPKSISWTYYLLKDSDTKRGLWKRDVSGGIKTDTAGHDECAGFILWQ